ncbi:CAP domain-containing protein [Miltoncostaea oceani]|uniref:CAP domain-containing protein n=1 Tax=Miltoncostaea oceani TaxID=2843216 RepID=UPI001C3E4988|nr:CAP domain-containing protein [Miltoncostaea oceani]
MRRLTALIVSSVLAAVALWLPSGGAAHSGASELAGLNAFRALHGLTPDLQLDDKLSSLCRARNEFFAQHPTQSGHALSPDLPGYSTQAAIGAAISGLGFGSFATPSTPFYRYTGVGRGTSAAYHLAPLISPRVTHFGADSLGGVFCGNGFEGYFDESLPGFVEGTMGTIRYVARPPDPVGRVYTFPGPGMPVPYEEFTGGERPIGIPEATGLPSTHGPVLWVMPYGGVMAGEFAYYADHAQVVGPEGAVAVRTIDISHPGVPTGNSGYAHTASVPDGVLIVVDAPLKPLTRYTATATVRGYSTGRTLSHTWSFTTGRPEPQETQEELNASAGPWTRPAPRPQLTPLRRVWRQRLVKLRLTVPVATRRIQIRVAGAPMVSRKPAKTILVRLPARLGRHLIRVKALPSGRVLRAVVVRKAHRGRDR